MKQAEILKSEVCLGSSKPGGARVEKKGNSAENDEQWDMMHCTTAGLPGIPRQVQWRNCAFEGPGCRKEGFMNLAPAHPFP